jgi:hypothetical protein
VQRQRLAEQKADRCSLVCKRLKPKARKCNYQVLVLRFGNGDIVEQVRSEVNILMRSMLQSEVRKDVKIWCPRDAQILLCKAGEQTIYLEVFTCSWSTYLRRRASK